jgi:hypothetical protein
VRVFSLIQLQCQGQRFQHAIGTPLRSPRSSWA